ncbi:MAG: 3-keto-5-aminohexanoate cleavage protein [Desulfobacula sp.]|jgi:3-keto-5-aminohexanoate cleavage enzyme
MEKLIITAAVTGAITMREQNPNIPYSTREIADAALAAWRAGASMVHLHVRDARSGVCKQDPDLFRELIQKIRSESDVIINVTTGGAPGISVQDRIAVIPELSSDPAVSPEMASLNCGSLNFGLLSRKQRTFILDDVQMNPWGAMLNFSDIMKGNHVKPELEVYDSAMINHALVLKSLDALNEPLHFSFVLGVLGGMQPTIENLVFLKGGIPKNASWSVCAVGLPIFTIAPAAIGMGGHVRVGLEDCVYIAKGVIAKSSAQMVEKIVRIASEMGREIATPKEARELLHIA